MIQAALPLDPTGSHREPDLRVELPWPPSVNRYWVQWATPPPAAKIIARLQMGEQGFYKWLRKATRVGGQLTPAGKAYKEAAAWLFRSKRRRFGDVRVAAWFVYHPPTRRMPDILNLDKAICDAAQLAGVVDDDRQFVDVRQTLGEPRKRGAVDVRIWRLA